MAQQKTDACQQKTTDSTAPDKPCFALFPELLRLDYILHEPKQIDKLHFLSLVTSQESFLIISARRNVILMHNH